MKALPRAVISIAALIALTGCSGGTEEATSADPGPDAPAYEVVDRAESENSTDITVQVESPENLEAVFEAVRADNNDADGGYYVTIDCAGRPEGSGPGRLGNGRYAVGNIGAAVTGLDDGDAEFEPIDGPVCPLPEPNTDGAAGDDRVYPGGQSLTEYEGLTSYPWRVAVVDQQDELLAAMQAVAPHLEVDDYGDLISTCDSADGGTDRATLITQGVTRFSGAPDEQVTEQQAATLVELALTRVCPGIL